MNEYAGSLKTQCRACLEIAPRLYPLVGNIANCDVTIAKMISYCTLTEMDLSEDLPSGFCMQCFRTTRIAYNFIRQYRESQKKLFQEKNEVETANETEIKNEVENEASEEERSNVYSESQTFQSEKLYPVDEEQQTGDENEEDISENIKYIEQEADDEVVNEDNVEEVVNEDNVNEIEFYPNNDDVLVERLESGLYEVEDSASDNNYKVRIIRNEKSPKSHENTIFRMKVNTRYTCPVCPNEFYREFKRGLMEHMELHEGETFTCNTCTNSPTIYDKDSFLKHYVDVHLNQCHFCEKSFAKRTSMLYHVKTHTSILYSCKHEGCTKVYPSRTALNKHETTHANTVRHICSECGEKFKTYDTFKYHMNRHDGKKFLCSICGRTFILSVNLKNHMLTHKGGRPFSCSFCDKTYTSYTPLNKHMRKYHADRKRGNSRYYKYDEVS
ncbi:uncharacterized protein [Leptinotarsa decemlineata]|uniref:uncharacterized protein n=1 Tax=Leptinotarsa decemlineata TaxID=7539 RepID=UPI003D306B3F